MAGWLEWKNLPIGSDNPMLKTTLETLWPRVDEVSRSQHWTGEWISFMRYSLAVQIIEYKKEEYSCLVKHDEMAEALLAGELFASNVYHTKVLLFEDAEEAVNWLVTHAKNKPPKMNHIVPETGQGEESGDYVPLMADMRNNNSWNFEKLTFERMLYIFYKRMGMRNDEGQTTINIALCHYICGLARMGHATNAWIASNVRAIRSDLSDPDIQLNRATMENVWHIYGVQFKPAAKDWQHLFSSFVEKCEVNSPQLKIICNQAAEYGFTAVKLVNDAIVTCSDFNCNLFENPKSPAEIAIKAELEIWKNEFELMKKNPFARFSGATGITKRIPNLGLLAKELLCRACGVNSVERYQGLNARNVAIRYAYWVRRIVDKYIDSQMYRTSAYDSFTQVSSLVDTERELEGIDKTTKPSGE